MVSTRAPNHPLLPSPRPRRRCRWQWSFALVCVCVDHFPPTVFCDPSPAVFLCVARKPTLSLCFNHAPKHTRLPPSLTPLKPHTLHLSVVGQGRARGGQAERTGPAFARSHRRPLPRTTHTPRAHPHSNGVPTTRPTHRRPPRRRGRRVRPVPRPRHRDPLRGRPLAGSLASRSRGLVGRGRPAARWWGAHGGAVSGSPNAAHQSGSRL